MWPSRRTCPGDVPGHVRRSSTAIEAVGQLGHDLTFPPASGGVNALVGGRRASADERRLRPLVGRPIPSRNASAPPPPRSAAAAVLRRAPRRASRPPRPQAAPPLVDLGRGNPEIGPPPHVVEALREAVLDPASTATRRSAACRGRRRRSPARYRDVYGVELDPSTRWRSSRARRPRIVELALALCDERRHAAAARPVLPGLPVGRRARGRAARDGAARSPSAGWAPDLDAAPAAAALYLNYPVEPVRRLRARRRLRGRGRLGAADRRRRRPRRGVHRPRLRRPATAELPRDARREGRRRRDVVDVEDVRHGRLADRLRRRQRRDRRADQPAQRPQPRRHLRAAAGGGDRRARRPAGLGRRAGRDVRAPARPDRGRAARAARLRGHLLRLAPAPGRADRRTRCSPSSASRSRPARASGRAAPAGCASRSPSTDEAIERGAERLHRAFAAVARA